MKERVERLAMEIREILGEIVTRQEIKDPRVQDAGLITITHVRLTGDLREATALFTVHGADADGAEEGAQGLEQRRRATCATAWARSCRCGRCPRSASRSTGCSSRRRRSTPCCARLLCPRARTRTSRAEGRGLHPMPVLVIDKPVGPTSFQVVRQVRAAAGPAGRSARPRKLQAWVTAAPWILRLGRAAGVRRGGDQAGALPAGRGQALRGDRASSASRPTPWTPTARWSPAARWTAWTGRGSRRLLAAVSGPQQQVPPMYSALKREGRPLYAYARAGEEVAREPRAITVHELVLEAWIPPATGADPGVRARRGPTSACWRPIWGGRRARARTCRRCAGPPRDRSIWASRWRWRPWRLLVRDGGAAAVRGPGRGPGPPAGGAGAGDPGIGPESGASACPPPTWFPEAFRGAAPAAEE